MATSTQTETIPQPLSSSVHSLSSSQHASSVQSTVARAYRTASSLFVTRRIAEALDTLTPIITSPPPSGTQPSDTDDEASPTQAVAPIAQASRGARVKVWSLYISILNEAISMGSDAGRKEFGSSRWKNLASQARDGTVWEEVVQHGYRGLEGDVDADVVANLATLLLAHAPDQKHTQQRLETYLSSYSNPVLDVEGHMAQKENGELTGQNSHANGASTPRDLNARLKILEIFTLHVLPRNDECEYAKEFLNMSEILDDERREAFLQALQNVEDERSLDSKKEQELQRQRELQMQDVRRREEEERRALEAEKEKELEAERKKQQRRSVNENDFGVDKSALGSTPKPNEKPVNGSSTSTKPQSSSVSHARKSSASSTRKDGTPAKKVSRAPPPNLFSRVASVGTSLQQALLALAQNLKAHPMVLIRFLAFLVAIVMALSRRDIRDRLRRARDSSWQKVAKTIGMGTKVSYV